MQTGLFSYILVKLHKCLDGTSIYAECEVPISNINVAWKSTDARMVPQVLADPEEHFNLRVFDVHFTCFSVAANPLIK